MPPTRKVGASVLAALLIPLTAAPVIAEPDPPPSTQIVGGQPAPDSYTFAARLEIRATSQGICTGWVYNQWAIVTAAHCVTEFPSNPAATLREPDIRFTPRGPAEHWLQSADDPADPRHYQVRIGPDVRSGTVIPARRIVTPPFNWGIPDHQGYVNDIALIFTAAPITTPPAIPLKPPPIGQPIRVTGFGMTDQATGEFPHQLHMADTTRISPDTCRGSGADEICTRGATGIGPCFGDSGGPVLTVASDNPHLVGVIAGTSRASGPSECGQHPEIQTNITAHTPWLRRETAKDALLRTTTR